MAIKMVPLSKIKDNPWRDKKRNPIDKEKVEQIAESIETTQEFWEGVYGREVGNFVELAFGHTRLDAAKMAGLKEIPITIRMFTDGDMLMWMSRENVRGELPVMLEAISAAVKALSEGKIELTPPSPKTRKDSIRQAPSYIPGGSSVPPGGTHPYTADSIAKFLGSMYIKPSTKRAQNSVTAALSILEAEERKIKGFSLSMLLKPEKLVPQAEDVEYDTKEAEGPKYKGAKEIIKIVSDAKKYHEAAEARREKTAAEMAEWHAEQKKIAQAIKEREAQEEKERKALLKKRLEAEQEKNEKEAKRIAEELRKKKAQAEVKAEKDVAKKLALDVKLNEIKEKAEAQKVVDAYAPIRRDVEEMIRKLETLVSESNPFREDVKVLSKNDKVTLMDRDRLYRAMQTAGDWYHEWAEHFAVKLKAGKQVLKEAYEKEEAKRRADAK